MLQLIKAVYEGWNWVELKNKVYGDEGHFEVVANWVRAAEQDPKHIYSCFL